MVLKGQAEHALASLGSTPEQVAENLQKAGIKGIRDNCSSCPIAVYLKQKTGHAELGVHQYSACFWDKPGVDAGVDARLLCHVELPSAVGRFIYLFDQRQYPQLQVST